MALNAGERLGSYEIVAPLGAGGMGEVYRAQDTKLGREVAIKVLPEEFTQHPQKLARFEREAKLLAALNHPGIATLHGLEEFEGKPFLVMELVEGETLADRISRGAMPVGEALEISQQIAEALEAAHEKGVIHRDLKPANIKVDPEGKVKVLDFGLAKAFAEEVPESELSQSPTLSRDATRAGVILGTAAYMSPEQAKGKTVDKRTDIFSFGIVLYEMLTGKRAFAGEDVSDILAAIIRAEPDWGAVPSTLDPRLQNLLRRCLTKDRKNRLRDIGDARFEMHEILTSPQATVEAHQPSTPWLGWGLSLLLGAIVGGTIVWSLFPEEPLAVGRFVVTTRATEPFASTAQRDVAIAPDGKLIVYRAGSSAERHLHLRSVDRLEGTNLFTATVSLGNPFFSPDGTWVGFSTVDDGTWKKVSILGGPSVTLFPSATPPRGASWGPDDTIILAQAEQGTGLFRGPAAGGELEVLTTPDTKQGELTHQWPHILPGGKAVLFNIIKGDGHEIAVLDLATGERKVLLPNGSSPHYARTGHIVYAVGPTLLAVPFDLDRLELTGDPVPLLDNLMTDPTGGMTSGSAEFSLSRDGSLLYVIGNNQVSVMRSLVWVDRQGGEEALGAEPRAYSYPRISPDGRQVALDVRDQESDIWIWDFDRETSRRLTFDSGRDQYPAWTPDGKRVVFGSTRAGVQNLFWKAADGTGTVERLPESDYNQPPQSVSPDGQYLVFRESRPGTGYDLGLLSLNGDASSKPLLATEFNEINGEISPDGRWMAYQSDASGQYEIYVRPFPNVDEGLQQVSRSGGTEPLWARDSSELFYLDRDRNLTAVSVHATPELSFGNPEIVLNQAFLAIQGALGRTYDISPDGKRFLVIKENTADEEAPPAELILVQNWAEELKRLVPTSD